MVDWKKKGQDRNTKKNWISQEWNKIFRWNKKHFSVFEGLSFGEKIKNSGHKKNQKSCFLLLTPTEICL